MRTLTWIEATHGEPRLEPFWIFLREQVASLAADRVAIRFEHLGVRTGGIRTVPNRLVNDAAVLARALTEENASDAIVIGCWGAPTEAVRAAVAIPVTSLNDASARIVESLARSAVMVTVSPSLVPIFEADLRAGAAGFHPQQPVRTYHPESTHDDILAALDDPEPLIARFDAEAQLAVEDGADAIVVGCGYLAPLFTAAGYTSVRGHSDVPVFDCNRMAMEHALMLLELQESGIRATERGYLRPRGAQREALAAAAASLNGEAARSSERLSTLK